MLSTKLNLTKKGIALDTLCPLCNMEDESADHVFLSYRNPHADIRNFDRLVVELVAM